MARNGFNFQAVLKLNSKDFQNGIKSVQKSLNSLKNSFSQLAGALGLGLGLGKFTAQLKATATDLSVAKATLENVSRETVKLGENFGNAEVAISRFGDNWNYVKQLSEEYGANIIAITQNYAQFIAASRTSNLTLGQQREIFESLVRAAAAYHMSADRTNDMMNAVTQMMSKGKVASEELRRQLGNSLPGAFNLMAAAMGVSTAQLEDMMKKSQVVAEDALPRFAKMLDEVTKNADFDSLQMSLSRFTNAWINLVDDSGAEGMFKSLVDGGTRAINSIRYNLDGIKGTVAGLVVAIGSYKLFSAWKEQGEKYLSEHERQIEKLEHQNAMYAKSLHKMGVGISPTHGAASPLFGPGGASTPDKEAFKYAEKYNNNLIKILEAKKNIYKEDALIVNQLNTQIESVKLINDQYKAYLGIQDDAVKGTTLWQNGTMGVKRVIDGIKASIKSLGLMTLVSAVLGVITKIVSAVRNNIKEWKEINNIFGEYEKSVAKVDQHSKSTEASLQSQLRIMQNENNSMSARLSALKKINEALGLTGEKAFNEDALDKTKKAYQDITAEVKRWCDASLLQAKIQAYANKNAEALAQFEKAQADKEEAEASLSRRKKMQPTDAYGYPMGSEVYVNPIGAGQDLNKIKKAKARMEQYRKVIADTEAKLDELGVSLGDLYAESSFNPTADGGSDIEDSLSKVYEKYKKEKDELTNQLREHAISQEKYNTELDKLNQKFWENASATGEMSIDKILAKMDKGKTLTAMEKWYKELKEAAEDAARRALLDGMVEDAIKEIDKAIEEQEKKLAKELEDQLEKDQKRLNIDLDVLTTTTPKKGSRNSLFDYGKEKSTIFGEENKLAADQAKELQKLIDDVNRKYEGLGEKSDIVKQALAKWSAELKLASKEAANFEAAMNFAKIQEDIKNIEKNIGDLVYGNIKNMATSLDRIVKGAQNIKEVMENSDSSGWDVFMAYFNQVTQYIDLIMDAFNTFTQISELSTKLSNAELSQQLALNAAKEAQVALESQILALKGEQAGAATEAAAADLGEAAAAGVATSAKAGEAIAGATASGSKLPFPYNIAAIAAGVAAVVAALASMSKFESGGIVGGNSNHGDRNIIRANSGELILNKHQQGTLYRAIASGNLGGGGGEWRVRGTDLIKVIENTRSKGRG